MNRRTITAASLVAALALSGLAGAVAAEDEVTPIDEESDARTTTGMVEGPEEVDGRMVYVLVVGEDRIELSFGPSWFWGERNPLHELVGTGVTIGGNLRDGMPNENASDVAKEKAAKDPVIKVKTIDGAKRAKGKPPWAGGPKDLGEVHPGYDGWSKGQAKKGADETS